MYLLKTALALGVSLSTVLVSVLGAAETLFAADLPTLPETDAEDAQVESELAPTLSVPATTQIRPNAAPATLSQQRLPLSPGDRISLLIPGVGGEEFSGEYEVSFNGSLDLPFLAPVPVAGLVTTEVEARLRDVLVAEQYFQPGLLQLSVQALDYSPIQVAVTGAVFEPGRVLLSTDSLVTSTNAEGEVIELPGDYPVERYLTSALKAIGGVRPTADVSQVQVLRGTESLVVDLSGVFSGSTVADFPLVAGDQVIVPDAGRFQEALIEPSQITPDSIDLYVSNVTEPGGGGVLDGTADINVASFEYGTTLAQALVSARCVGGTPSTNANRRAILIQTNEDNGALTTSEYNVNDLIVDAAEFPDENPFLMPDDAIACYDSRTTNVRGILGTVVDFLNPVNLLINLFDDDD